MLRRAAGTSSACWELRLIGESLLLAAHGSESDLTSKSKRFAVLLFLAMPHEGRRVRRDELLATFWPELDTARARSALHTTLHQLRQTLWPHAIGGSGEAEISLNTSVVNDHDRRSRARADAGDPGDDSCRRNRGADDGARGRVAHGRSALRGPTAGGARDREGRDRSGRIIPGYEPRQSGLAAAGSYANSLRRRAALVVILRSTHPLVILRSAATKEPLL
jgi:hypothetical protein